ncbi:MAG TPA: RES family NAD+ phosphorylase, partial [Acetobacteraceae bacterium]|nr:RES family NAD+ phosphorylase [Acetobacteraceae bacterium]
MLLWRLSGRQHANAFDGGYGLLFNGRWNTVGHAVTYCATSPSLCVL